MKRKIMILILIIGLICIGCGSKIKDKRETGNDVEVSNFQYSRLMKCIDETYMEEGEIG